MRQVPNTWEEKKGLKLIVPLLLLSLALLLVPASNAHPSTVVTISGMVSNVSIGLSVSVRAHASGTVSSLSGGGTDSPPSIPSPSANPAVCQFPLTGSVSGNTVTLAGTVTQSSVGAEIGTPVTFTADASTGTITWTFGGIPFTGTGTVVITTT